MSQLRRVHLFNCDRTYKFDSVEDLLTKAKVSFDTVEKHPFTLGQMSEMTTKIPSLGIDLAFFVVHAHESRLSINEDNAGIGYAKIYRALLNATGGNVIIVIGGDDNYRNKDEEDQVVISRWAKRKISSQFKEEFLDGSKSFIFSWNKRHRAIHEEALRHFFDPNKKGQKFEYQPPKRKLPPKPETPPVAKVTDKRPQQPSLDFTEYDLTYQRRTGENYQPSLTTRGSYKPQQNDAMYRQKTGDLNQPSSYTIGSLSDPLQSDAEHPKKGEDQMHPNLPYTTSATMDKLDIYHTTGSLSDPLQSGAEHPKKGVNKMYPDLPCATMDKLDTYSGQEKGHARPYPLSSYPNAQRGDNDIQFTDLSISYSN